MRAWATPAMPPIKSNASAILCFISTNGAFLFGGAKPVRINPLAFRNPSFGMMVTAAAGPISNFLQAILGFAVLYLLWIINPELAKPMSYNALFFGNFIVVNVVLGVFNLIPIPPLDGSKVLFGVLPYHLQKLREPLERYGFFIVLIFIAFGWEYARPVIGILFSLFTGIALS